MGFTKNHGFNRDAEWVKGYFSAQRERYWWCAPKLILLRLKDIGPVQRHDRRTPSIKFRYARSKKWLLASKTRRRTAE